MSVRWAAQFTPAGTTLTGSRTYGPWGATLATGGILSGALGYQSQYTSPATGQVDMGARWYNPAIGSFGNKDTVSNKPIPDSASASPFGYAADNPLNGTDPTGHRPIDDSGQTDKGWLAAQVTNAKKASQAKVKAAAIAAAARTGPVRVAVAVTSVKAARAAAAQPADASHATQPIYISPHFGFNPNTTNITELKHFYNEPFTKFAPFAPQWVDAPGQLAAYAQEVQKWFLICHETTACPSDFTANITKIGSTVIPAMNGVSSSWGCYLLGNCNYTPAMVGMVRLYRAMDPDPDNPNIPKLGNNAKSLSFRVPNDYKVGEDGLVYPHPPDDPGGLSTNLSAAEAQRRGAIFKAKANWWIDSEDVPSIFSPKPDPKDATHIMWDVEESLPDTVVKSAIQGTQLSWKQVIEEGLGEE